MSEHRPVRCQRYHSPPACQAVPTQRFLSNGFLHEGFLSLRLPGRRSRPLTVIGLALVAGALMFQPPGLLADDWPQFRGVNCAGIASDSAPLPAQFDPSQNLAWSAKLGDGIGSPVVADGRLFISEMSGEQEVSLVCFDAASGKELWRRAFDTGLLPDIHKTNSHAATTCAADASRVYFYFSTLGLIACDAATGEQLWQRKLPEPYFVFKWGPGMSPILLEDKVIFCQDDDLNPAIYALDKADGRILWQVARDDMAVNYSHPVVCETENGLELIVAGTGKLIAYDPDTGQERWFARVLLRNIKTTPAVADGVIYISLQSGGIANQWLASVDRAETGNNDGKLTKDEIQAFVGERKVPEAFFKKFDRGDTNGDGVLEGPEIDQAFLSENNFGGARWNAANPSDQYILAVKAGGRGDVTESHLLWKHRNRAPDHIVSPLVVNGRMFVVKGGGISSCFRTEDGQPLWSQKRIDNTGEYFASPIYGDGKIYVVGENGYVVVLKDSPSLEILSVNDLGESCLATPAIAGGRIYFRTRTQLLCFEQK